MSLSAAQLEYLAAKGLSLGEVVEFAKLGEARSSNAERQARYRDRQRNVTRNVTRVVKEKIPQTPYKENTTPSISSEIDTPPNAKSDLKATHFVEAWNELADEIGRPRVRNLTPERRIAVNARIAGYTLDEFREVLGNIRRSPFLRGEKNWTGCTFDWVIKKSNFQKILEGNYNG